MRRMRNYSVVKMLVLAAVAALGIVGPAEAFVINWAPVGIITGEIFRVAVANFGAAPCEVAVFIDAADGTSLLAERGIVIDGGKVVVREVPFGGATPDAFRRLEIVAQVVHGGACGHGILQASVQVFTTATGQTLLVSHGIIIELMPGGPPR